MFYDPRLNDHHLEYNPFNALVIPRPIAWVTTLSSSGVVNLAPYSYYNAICSRPPIVCFSSTSPKHSRQNAEVTGEFVVNLVTLDLKDQMHATSAELDPEVSEPEHFEIEMAPSINVKPPRVKASPAAMECRYLKTVELATEDGSPVSAALVIGQVVGVYVDDKYLVNGRVELASARPLSRLGYKDYSFIDQIFPMG